MAGSHAGALFSLLSSTTARLGAQRAASHPVVLSPFQEGTPFRNLSYQGLTRMSSALAQRMLNTALVPPGFKEQKKQLAIVSDLPNVGENLLLQLACSKLGIAYLTTKDEAGLAEALTSSSPVNLVGGVAATRDSWLLGAAKTSSSSSSDFKVTAAEEFFADLQWNVGETIGGVASQESDIASTSRGTDEKTNHGYFNTLNSPLPNTQIVQLAKAAQTQLQLMEKDSVLISITLCHQFGIASGVGAALLAGSTIVLPAVGGIRGCGVPAERAAAVRQVLAEEACTILFSDAPIVKQLLKSSEDGGSRPQVKNAPGLRSGVVKTGSGSDFLDEKMEVAGIPLWTMGARK